MVALAKHRIKNENMMSYWKFLTATVPVLFLGAAIHGQTKAWTLQDCIEYAIDNNITLQQSRNSFLSGLEDTYQAKAAMLPSVSASTSQGLSKNRCPSRNSCGLCCKGDSQLPYLHLNRKHCPLVRGLHHNRNILWLVPGSQSLQP